MTARAEYAKAAGSLCLAIIKNQQGSILASYIMAIVKNYTITK